MSDVRDVSTWRGTLALNLPQNLWHGKFRNPTRVRVRKLIVSDVLWAFPYGLALAAWLQLLASVLLRILMFFFNVTPPTPLYSALELIEILYIGSIIIALMNLLGWDWITISTTKQEAK